MSLGQTLTYSSVSPRLPALNCQASNPFLALTAALPTHLWCGSSSTNFHGILTKTWRSSISIMTTSNVRSSKTDNSIAFRVARCKACLTWIWVPQVQRTEAQSNLINGTYLCLSLKTAGRTSRCTTRDLMITKVRLLKASQTNSNLSNGWQQEETLTFILGSTNKWIKMGWLELLGKSPFKPSIWILCKT